MRGTIVIHNDAGRNLRSKPAAVKTADVLGCSGGFSAGDRVYIAFRTADGSQFVIATGIVRCDEPALRQRIESTPSGASVEPRHDHDVVIGEQDVQLLWSSPR